MEINESHTSDTIKIYRIQSSRYLNDGPPWFFEERFSSIESAIDYIENETMFNYKKMSTPEFVMSFEEKMNDLEIHKITTITERIK